METIRQSKLIVNMNNIKHNINQLQKYVGPKVEIMPVIKARSYGTGIGSMPEFFDDLGIKILAVAVVDEGIALRSRDYSGEVFILNQPLNDEIEMILKFNLTVNICEYHFIELLNKAALKQNKKVKVHLEIDTGMGRTGIKPDEIEKYIKLLKNSASIKVEGICTHFSSSDSNPLYTKKQIDIFNQMVNIFKKSFKLKYIHACNSAGIINFKEAHYNLVRPGIALYGHLPVENLQEKIKLLPATKLETKISHIHDIKEGESVSYNRSYIAKRSTKVAVIPLGYADGIMRSYSGKVVIKGELAAIIGIINMDSFMVDITDIKSVEVGDYVYLWDNENITLEDVAKGCQTISYEILSRLAPRIVKEFINN